jgi:hypothetical protein
MHALRFPIDVVIERRRLTNRWMGETWQPANVEVMRSGRGEFAECLGDDGPITQWRVGPYTIELHPTEAEGYFLNLTSPAPCVFIMWRMFDDRVPPARPVVVTVSYNEAGRLLDGGERVDNVPMPPEIMAWMKPFVAAHYKPEPRRKVKRNDPFAADAAARERESHK